MSSRRTLFLPIFCLAGAKSGPLLLHCRVNSNVDLIVGGTALLRRLNLPPSGGHGVDHAVLRTAAQLEEAFSFSFSRGAGVERAFSDPEGYAAIVDAASQLDDADVSFDAACRSSPV